MPLMMQRKKDPSAETVGDRTKPVWKHGLFLLLCIFLACGLRFLNLGGKPLWTDEFGTLGLAQGRGFSAIPVNETIDFQRLMTPMRGGSTTGFLDVIATVVAEDVHPPLHFGILNLWLKVFAPDENEYVSARQMRSLGAAMGIIAVAVMAWLGWVSFHSPWAALAAAWFMAVSPFGVYLFQETRMYYLAVIWIAFSLGFFLIALRRLRAGRTPPVWLFAAWMTSNALGLATHYFHILALFAQVTALMVDAVINHRNGQPWTRQVRLRMIIYAGVTLMVLAPLVPVLAALPGHEMSRWLQRTLSDWHYFIDPIPELMAILITFFFLLPVQNVPPWIPVLSFLLVFPFFLWTVLFFRRGYARLAGDDSRRRTGSVLLWILMFSLLILLGITYLTGRFLTAALRYGFFFFPVVLLWASGAIASWVENPSMSAAGLRRQMALIGLMGLLGGFTVALDFGYSKSQQPDIVARIIGTVSRAPIVVAVGHRHTWCQVAELQSLAWALEKERTRGNMDCPPRYLLVTGVKDDLPDYSEFKRILKTMDGPLDFWALNFDVLDPGLPNLMRRFGFLPMEQKTKAVDGYLIRHFRRPTKEPLPPVPD
ncbi:MAG: hypothetical protein JW950_03690 [Deltaproteobacteria bacterium]|nr:hypothetical protein [Deltaproteobacteria bacterium]